jgi:DNA-directed RNA polymerase specialized sigma24 family protein
MLGNMHEAEDAVQESFLKAYEKIETTIRQYLSHLALYKLHITTVLISFAEKS